MQTEKEEKLMSIKLSNAQHQEFEILNSQQKDRKVDKKVHRPLQSKENYISKYS